MTFDSYNFVLLQSEKDIMIITFIILSKFQSRNLFAKSVICLFNWIFVYRLKLIAIRLSWLTTRKRRRYFVAATLCNSLQ
jgi:hypothetical protein